MAKARDIPGLEADLPFREAASLAVATRAEEVWEHEHRVLDTGDIEGVHDMRVATRRLRAVLEVFAACFEPAAHREVLRDVKELADALGARRDPDVQLASLDAFAAAVPAPDLAGVDVFAQRLRVEQAQGNQTLAAALSDAEQSDLRGRLAALVAA
jgi:CHAD domain-containing protein